MKKSTASSTATGQRSTARRSYLDATTGQNALNQVRLFNEAAKITGVVLTKLDGTAKGGVVVAIESELGVPVRFAGVGEGVDDLQVFDSASFVRAMFE